MENMFKPLPEHGHVYTFKFKKSKLSFSHWFNMNYIYNNIKC